jgi:ABC-type bacteriocin/lantibiotic exporter with double-glycine peptidase domain
MLRKNKEKLINLKMKSIVLRAFEMLDKKTKRKLAQISLVQFFLSILDLVGVATIGIIGSLVINGSASRQPGDRVSLVLNFLGLTGKSIQFQAFVLGSISALLLIGKTLVSIYYTRKILFFLSYRGSVITQELVSKILSQDLVSLQSRSRQETMFALTVGVNNVIVGVLANLVTIISDLFLLIIMLFGLFYVDTVIAISTVTLFCGVALLLYKSMHQKASSLGKKSSFMSIKTQEQINQVLNTFRETVVGGKRKYYIKKIGETQLDLANINSRLSFLPNIGKYVMEITVIVGFMIISGIQFIRSDAAHSVAVLAIFLAASTRIAPAILRIQQGAIQFKSAAGSASPTLDLFSKMLTNTSDQTDTHFSTTHKNFKPRIEMTNIDFKYNTNSKFVIENLNLTIEPGELIAVVGPSGSGKTTLIDIMLGVVVPNSGSVKISDCDISNLPTVFPGAAAYVPQEVQIINGTIRENLALGYNLNEIPEVNFWNILTETGLSEFVSNTKDKLDTYLGDEGNKLSGGQKQRLGIARALLTKPKLLVMDEATSALDSQSEQTISNILENIRGKSTIVLIAHRLSTVRKADKVIYVSDGKIIALGTFDEVRQLVPNFDDQAKLLGI